MNAKKNPIDNLCPNCGNQMKESKSSLSYPIDGEEIKVANSPHLFCPKCKEVILRKDEVRLLRENAMAIYRKKYGLLSGEEIKRLRERLEFSQIQLADLLRLGVNTISRWESGRNVQSASMDILLRLIRDVPESRDYLKKLAA